jgi:hypothetical protein
MPLGDEPLSGFIRSLGAGGRVATVTPSGSVVPQSIISPRATQQLFRSYQAPGESYEVLECQSNHLCLQASVDTSLMTAELNWDAGQQWQLSPDGHLSSAAMGDNVLAIRNGAYAIVARDTNDIDQKFEYVYPAAEFYIRNSRTGFFLRATALATGAVDWNVMTDSDDDRLRWYYTPSKRLVNRATGKVLQATGSVPGTALTVAEALPVGPGSVYQSFVLSGGTLRCLAAESLAVTFTAFVATLATASSSDSAQLIEFVSPFSFFQLKATLPQPAGAPPVDLWLTFDGTYVGMSDRRSGSRAQLFSASVFGQIFCAEGGQVAWFNTANQPPIYLGSKTMSLVRNGSLPQVTFQFEGEILSSGARGLIRFPPGSSQLCTVTMVQTTPRMTISDVVNDPSQTQIWDIVDPMEGAMRFFMEHTLIRFSNPTSFPQ